jgi:hypothetical protein
MIENLVTEISTKWKNYQRNTIIEAITTMSRTLSNIELFTINTNSNNIKWEGDIIVGLLYISGPEEFINYSIKIDNVVIYSSSIQKYHRKYILGDSFINFLHFHSKKVTIDYPREITLGIIYGVVSHKYRLFLCNNNFIHISENKLLPFATLNKSELIFVPQLKQVCVEKYIIDTIIEEKWNNYDVKFEFIEEPVLRLINSPLEFYCEKQTETEISRCGDILAGLVYTNGNDLEINCILTVGACPVKSISLKKNEKKIVNLNLLAIQYSITRLHVPDNCEIVLIYGMFSNVVHRRQLANEKL